MADPALTAFDTVHAVYSILDDEADSAALRGLDSGQVAKCRAALRELLPMSHEDHRRARALSNQVRRVCICGITRGCPH